MPDSYSYPTFYSTVTLQVCATDEFKGLSKDQLVRLLRSEELRIEDEYQVFTAAMDWVLQDVAKRKKYIVEVLEPVRFPLLSPQRLFKYIEGRISVHLSSLYLKCSLPKPLCA